MAILGFFPVYIFLPFKNTCLFCFYLAHNREKQNTETTKIKQIQVLYQFLPKYQHTHTHTLTDNSSGKNKGTIPHCLITGDIIPCIISWLINQSPNSTEYSAINPKLPRHYTGQLCGCSVPPAHKGHRQSFALLQRVVHRQAMNMTSSWTIVIQSSREHSGEPSMCH